MKEEVIWILATIVFAGSIAVIVFLAYLLFVQPLVLIALVFVGATFYWVRKRRNNKSDGERPKISRLKLAILLVILAIAALIGWNVLSAASFPWLIIIPVVLIVSVVGMIALGWWLVNQNLFGTLVPENWARIVLRNFGYKKTLIQSTAKTIDEQGYVVPENQWVKDGIVVDEKTQGAKKYKEPPHWGGLRWVGIPPFDGILEYAQEWAHLKVGLTPRVVPHNEYLDVVFLGVDIYIISSPKGKSEDEESEQGKLVEKPLEDRENVPLIIKWGLPMRIVNPRIAILEVKNWYPMIVSIFLRTAGPFVARHTFDPEIKSMISDKGDSLKDEHWKMLEEEFRGEGAIVTPEGNLRIYGVELIRRGFGIIAVDTTKEYAEAMTKEFMAEQERKATIIRAKAEKQKVVIAAKAEAERLEIEAKGQAKRISITYEEIKKYGDLGKLIRTLEAVEKSPLAASMTVQAIPGIQEILRGVFGAERADAITKEDITILLQELKQMAKNVGELGKEVNKR